MKSYLIYGNCQSRALSYTLNKNIDFKNIYKEQSPKFVHNLNGEDTSNVRELFSKTDLLIYQHISDNYRFSGLSTNNLLKYSKCSSISISFASLYFNAYFPHLDTFGVHASILNQVHDYIIMSLYVKGMNQQEILDLINSENLYTNNIAVDQLDNSLNILKEKEQITDIKIAGFIEQEYQNIKLFNQFNHPKGIIFDNLANQIFKILNIPKIIESVDSKTGLDGIMTPIYKSTYQQLDLKFDEDFTLYSTREGKLEQDEVVSKFLKFYSNIDKNEIKISIETKKPFLVKMFKELHI